MTTLAAKFSDLPVHPALARALAKRAYENATSVQAAVLAPELSGKDLLVSSQTGSGKTVAFGTLLAATLLGDEDKRVQRGKVAPLALVVAPTRELATQVCRELMWLLAETGLRVGAFTGGTPVGGDVRALRGGVDVVVGTPGRLVDLTDRGALSLAAIRCAVLDEADEMLDLGFREDLEKLLQQAPSDRRTLLFSATLPREIVALASKFQRDAARVDPRAKQGPGAAPVAHADITYVAHLIHPKDRLAAVVNTLLAAGDVRGIVFCRTRDRVSELHQRLNDLGFKATSMAGDRAQNERDRALEALRSGSMQILVATNVAARGLDLPDVELVVHADLPENAESLAHRSGRTGRAGRKGTSVVIADLGERRKAERLLGSARIPLVWKPAPAAADVRRLVHERLLKDLLAENTKVLPSPNAADSAADLDGLIDRLRAAVPERALLALLLTREARRLPSGMPVSPVSLEGPRRAGPAPGPHGMSPGLARGAAERFEDRSRAPDRMRPLRPAPAARQDGEETRADFRNAAVFRISLGANAKAEPGWLLPLICQRGEVTRRVVGAIRVGAQSSTFEIAGEAADHFARAAARPDAKAPHVTISRAQEGTVPAPRVPKKRAAGAASKKIA